MKKYYLNINNKNNFFITLKKFLLLKHILILINIIIIKYFKVKIILKEENIKNMQEFININLNGELINSNMKFHKILNPNISVIISIYNGELYLKTALRSIQNQDFKSIEIIMVDDHSKDNTVELIKEFMKEDPRIVFLQNNENKGALYTKTKGILNSKGKYVLTLDVDDLYISRDAFSTLYNVAEKDNLDILGFSILICNRNITNKPLKIHHNYKTSILFQPNVRNMMYTFGDNEKPYRVGDVISCYFIKKNLFVESIKEIGEEYLNKKIIVHDDFFCLFMLTRKAKNLKQIKKPLYLILLKEKLNSTLSNFYNNEKYKLRKKHTCLSYIYYIEYLLKKTDNSFKDKQIASLELENWYLNHDCRNDTFSKQEGINTCKLYLENQYINENVKNKIKIFLKENEKT